VASGRRRSRLPAGRRWLSWPREVVHRRPRLPRSERARALRGFGWMGLASLVLVAVPVIWLMSTIVTQHALQGVAEDSEQLARLTMAPVLTAPAVRGDRAAVARVDLVVRSRMSDGSVRRITVWDADGKVVYADRAELRGHRFRLPPEAAQRFAPGSHPAAVLADNGAGGRDTASAPGQAWAAGPAVEGYAAATARSGDRLVVEAAFPPDEVTREQRGLLVRLLPVLLLALLAVYLLQLPPALRLASRVQGSERSRRRLLRQSVAASDRERRRIAQTLHDDVVQDLSAVGYALESVEPELEPSTRPVIDRVRAIVQRDVSTLRQILTSVYPPDLEDGDLASALADLAQPLVADDVAVELSVDEEVRVSPTVAATVYRAAREALQNVRAHAQAKHVLIRLSREADAATLHLHDDGVGFDAAADLPVQGHFGLRLIHDTVTEAGGEVSITSAPGTGTCIRMRVPLA
jgi:signal transduction histidine kinase